MGVTLEFQARDMIQGTKLNDATQLFVGMWVCDWKIEDKILKLTKQLKFRQANWTNDKNTSNIVNWNVLVVNESE